VGKWLSGWINQINLNHEPSFLMNHAGSMMVIIVLLICSIILITSSSYQAALYGRF
jgi:hypothetical protein